MDLIDDVFIDAFDNPSLNTLEDQARFQLSDLAQLGDRLAMTTDSYVIDPIFFPGGDIGKISILRHSETISQSARPSHCTLPAA